jgi:cell shape-determining protein MreD
MTRARVAAAMAGIITVLLLQATLIAPLFVPWPVSLPAVLVAAVALVDGPATGMSFGFAAGLTADLGSHHPAGVLAMTWLGVGLLCGTVADRRSLRRDAVAVGLAGGLAAAFGGLLLALVRSSGSSVHDALLYSAPAALGDAALAFAVVAVVRRMLEADSLRAPHPVYTELVLGPSRG